MRNNIQITWGISDLLSTRLSSTDNLANEDMLVQEDGIEPDERYRNQKAWKGMQNANRENNDK